MKMHWSVEGELHISLNAVEAVALRDGRVRVRMKPGFDALDMLHVFAALKMRSTWPTLPLRVVRDRH